MRIFPFVLSWCIGMLFCLASLTNPASAQLAQQAPPRPQPIKILGIRVESPSPIDTASVIFYSGLQVGDYIDPRSSRIPEAIKSLWKRRQFGDVNIVIDRVSSDGVYLLIKLIELQHISAIQVIGNTAVNTKDILKALDKKEGDVITPYDLELGQKAIKKLYDKENKPFAKVDVKAERTDTAGFSRVVITTKESVTFFIKSITFPGAKQFTDQELASAFEDTKVKQWWEIWKSDKFEQKKYEKDRDERLATFFRKNGYIDAQMLGDSLRFNDTTETVDIAIKVEEGRKVYIRNITFEGNLVFPAEFLAYRLAMQKGDLYNADKFDKNLNGNEDQTDVSSIYLNNGYLTARLEKEEKRAAPDSVDILIRVFERNQFTVRRVEIEGNTKTKDKVIRRELFVRPGDFFNRAAVIRSVRALGQINYFNPEKLRPDVKLADNTNVDITFKVEERSNDTFNMSFGYAGQFGFTGSVGITLNNFSVLEPLQGGGGQIFNLNYERGGGFGQQGFGASQFTFAQGAISTFTLGLTEPWLFDEPTTLGFNVFSTQQLFFGGIQRTGASLNIGRRFRFPDDYFRGDWTIQGLENSAIQGFGTAAPTNNIFFTPGLEFSISQTISRVSIDNALFPSDGSRFTLLTKLSGGAFGLGLIDYFKNQLSLESFTPLLQIAEQNRLALRLNAELGYVTSLGAANVNSKNLIPPLERYYMGGTVLGGFAITPLRGYPDSQIGTRQPSETSPLGDRPNGGRAMMLLNAELRFAVTLNPVPIYAMAFVEAGNVWDQASQINPFDLKRSAGVGVRFLIQPIGLLGFDYAYAFDRVIGLNGQPFRDENGPPGWRFHFQFGR
ncbi:MAG: outer membrane protein assembly factor BamA [Candidatus Kapaibacterium sp.]|nr:MAG: outer membrane protein assembly factor BamA [Candidatus Kapabacteria bacterium]